MSSELLKLADERFGLAKPWRVFLLECLKSWSRAFVRKSNSSRKFASLVLSSNMRIAHPVNAWFISADFRVLLYYYSIDSHADWQICAVI